MAASTSDRITRMGSGAARVLASFGVFAVVLVMAGVLTVVGVDTVEVVATVLVAVVFGVALFLGQGPGLVVAALATGLYVVLRRSDIEAAGAANFSLLVFARAVAYGVVSIAGARAGQLIDDLTPGGAPVDDRGLRSSPANVQAPMFVFDDDGHAEPVPVGAGMHESGAGYEPGWQQAGWDDPGAAEQHWEGEPGGWDMQAPTYGPAPAPMAAGADWSSSPQFYAGSGPHPQVPDEAYEPVAAGYPDDGYGPDPRSGGYQAVPGGHDQGWESEATEGWAEHDVWESAEGYGEFTEPGPGPGGSWQADDGRGYVPGGQPAPGLGLTPSGRWDRVPEAPGGMPGGLDAPGGQWGGPPSPDTAVPWDQIPVSDGLPALVPAAAGPSAPSIPPIDPETHLWSARYLCDRLASEQQAAAEHGEPFSLVLVQVPDGPLAALSYRRQVTLLRELGHQFVAGGAVDHLVHVPDQTQHWFAVVLPGADRYDAQQFERRLRDGVGGYLRSRGLLLSELESASLTSPDDDEAMGAIWESLLARGDAGAAELAYDY